MNATARVAAASQRRPRPAKPSRTNPIPGTIASRQTAPAFARSGSRAARDAKASTATTQPISPAYQPVEIRSTGIKVKWSVLKPGVRSSQPAHRTQASRATPPAASASP